MLLCSGVCTIHRPRTALCFFFRTSYSEPCMQFVVPRECLACIRWAAVDLNMNAQNACEGTFSFVREGTNVLDGKAIAESVRAEVKKEADALEREYDSLPSLLSKMTLRFKSLKALGARHTNLKHIFHLTHHTPHTTHHAPRTTHHITHHTRNNT
jgi:hypothetical protein